MMTRQTDPEEAPFLHYYFSPAPRAVADKFVALAAPFVELAGGAIASEPYGVPEGAGAAGEPMWGLRLMLPEPVTPASIAALGGREWAEVGQPLYD